MKTRFTTLLGLLFVSVGTFGTTRAQQSPILKCDTTIKGGQYRLISESRALRGDDLLIFIVVEPKKINEIFMKQVAARIKARYCKEDKLMVVIADKKEFAEPSVLSDYRESNGKIVKMRGYYSLNRKAGTEELEFSTIRGNPTDEVKVKL